MAETGLQIHEAGYLSLKTLVSIMRREIWADYLCSGSATQNEGIFLSMNSTFFKHYQSMNKLKNTKLTQKKIVQ